ncbi:MATE family efflux transporter [Salegentibacter mishustinae]|uniref:Multidrug-efflux transporter n=1 Tax=Salegentibacter mishustinae TaxID=270918 RepID=A0A0Q9ZIX7_9FLAO|nr:MATE family efflux transporter [Salegentibacter mishustinae]KRG28232.1 MATE family efflux transporter [Salegentibacter mishustinae]PNW22167.1 MATE family efflux transporter [Salegentibacter mishustinae]PZX67384.1 putative MATE family efflux protein [Salegentibacter mishustinae]GGW80133.1 MATE efflux family protein [Salegentibacter mishustinae]
MEESSQSIPVKSPKRNLWKALLEAIKGTEVDYTTISLNRAIFLLAVPMILELVMESTFALVDIYFVGKLGASAVASVGLTETYLFLLYSIGMGLAMAVTAIIARRIGEKKGENAAESAVQSIILAILFAIPFSIAGIFYAEELLGLMGADDWTLTNGISYFQWMLGGNVVIMLLFVINAVFRGAGDAAIAMWVLGIANGINIVLDPLLIFGWGPIPSMGLEGAAIATNIGRSLGVLVQLWILFRGGKHIKVKLSQLYWNTKAMLIILKTSMGGIGQMIIGMTSWIFLMRILADIGSEAVAGATIALRIMLFCMMPAWGLSNAATTLVGQNLGAKDPQRAESSIWKIGKYNMIFLLLVSIVFFFFNERLIGYFSDTPEVIKVGGKWLEILSYSFFIYGWWMVTTQAFNGSGDTTTPTKINFVFFWLIQIPLAYFLAINQDWGYSGVFWAVFFSETSAAIFTLWLFTRGKWKTQKV